MPPLRRALPGLDLPLLQHRASEDNDMSNCSEIESCFACESCLNDYLRAGLTTRSNIVATLPTGERVELPAGTVLREGSGGRAYEPTIIAMREPRPVCCKAAIECSALNWQPLVPSWQMTWGCVQHCPFCGAPLLTPGVDPVLADLTERVGLPREMAPSVEPDPWLRGLTITTANAIRSGIDRGLPAKAGVAAVIAAFQAGVDMAIPPKP